MSGRKSGRGRGRGASAELLRDVHEDLGGLQPDDEPPPRWPLMALPNPQPITEADLARIRKFRETTERLRASPAFRAACGTDVKPFLAALRKADTTLPDELLRRPRAKGAKRKRSEFPEESRLRRLEDEERRHDDDDNVDDDDDDDAADDDPDDDEPEDYIKNHYESGDEDSGGEEPTF